MGQRNDLPRSAKGAKTDDEDYEKVCQTSRRNANLKWLPHVVVVVVSLVFVVVAAVILLLINFYGILWLRIFIYFTCDF